MSRFNTFVNLTPHTIRLRLPSGQVQVFEPRLPTPEITAIKDADLNVAAGMPFTLREPVEAQGVPAPMPGVGFLIETRMHAMLAGCGRSDLFCVDPDPNWIRRDESGRIVHMRLIGFTSLLDPVVLEEAS